MGFRVKVNPGFIKKVPSAKRKFQPPKSTFDYGAAMKRGQLANLTGKAGDTISKAEKGMKQVKPKSIWGAIIRTITG